MLSKNCLTYLFNKKLTFLIPIFFCIFYVATARAQPHKSIEIMVEDDSAPWSNPDGTGYTNDIVKAAFNEMKIKAHLIVVPYARCKRMALNGMVAACFNMSWLPEFEGQVKLAKYPLALYKADVFERIDKPLAKQKAGQCKLDKGIKVAIVNDYEYPSEVVSLAKSGTVFEKTHGDNQSLQMLAAGRMDAAIITTTDLSPIGFKLIEEKVEKKVRFAFNCGQATATIGFSVKHSDGVWGYQAYEDGYNRLVKEKKILKKIRRQWFPKSDGSP